MPSDLDSLHNVPDLLSLLPDPPGEPGPTAGSVVVGEDVLAAVKALEASGIERSIEQFASRISELRARLEHVRDGLQATTMSQEINDDDLTPSQTAGYKLGQEKSLAELAALDQEDESLQKWKASLGLGQAGMSAGPKRVVPKTLYLLSPSLHTPLTLDLTQPPAEIAKLKKNPINIKEGIEYSVGIEFTVENQIVSGLKYLQVVKRSGIKVDKTEKMIGSHGPQAEPYRRIIAEEESPSGMIARSGTYNVRSRIVDDDGVVYVDFEWAFKLATSW